MLVIDASALLAVLLQPEGVGAALRARLRAEEALAPEVLDLEVLTALGNLVRAASIGALEAGRAVEALADLPLRRVSHLPLLARCWELRHNVTPYDAAHVALAEVMGATLVTADARLARASGPRCAIDLVTD